MNAINFIAVVLSLMVSSAISADVRAEECTYKYEIEVWRKDAMLNGNKMDHTATSTIIHQHCGNIKKIFKVVDKCNHGGCPGQAKMYIKHRHISKAETVEPLYPVGCDFFGHDYGLTGSRHLCNNDTFMQMGQIVTGTMPDEITVKRICKNKNYEKYTGRDPKYTPSFVNVEAFVAKWGWATPKTLSGGGGSSPPPNNTPRRMP